MKNRKIATFVREAARFRAERATPAGRLYDDLCGDLGPWCRHRCAVRRRRRTDIICSAVAVCILSAISFSSATIMAQQLPDCKMNVSKPFLQKSMYSLSSEVIKLL